MKENLKLILLCLVILAAFFLVQHKGLAVAQSSVAGILLGAKLEAACGKKP